MVGELAALAALAGLLALDASAVAQTMVSQPVVAGALAGLVCGEPGLGALAGVVLQLVWLGALPVGAAGFPDAATGTVAGVGSACLAMRAGAGPGLALPVGLAVALVVGETGRLLILAQRRWNVRLSDEARRRAGSGDPGGIRRAVLLGIAVRFVSSAALVSVALAAAALAIRVVSVPGPRVGYASLVWAAPIAAAVVASRCGRARERVLMAAGFAGGLVFVFSAW